MRFSARFGVRVCPPKVMMCKMSMGVQVCEKSCGRSICECKIDKRGAEHCSAEVEV